jgi:hypothetical protein
MKLDKKIASKETTSVRKVNGKGFDVFDPRYQVDQDPKTEPDHMDPYKMSCCRRS